MKIIAKTKAVLLSNKAESMVEVTVAFMLLVIVITLLTQGVRSAHFAEKYSIDTSRNSDSAMKELLHTIVTGSGKAVVQSTSNESLDDKPDMLKLRAYKVPSSDGGDHNIYFVFDTE